MISVTVDKLHYSVHIFLAKNIFIELALSILLKETWLAKLWCFGLGLRKSVGY